MEIKFLSWDSSFFDKKVGKIEFDTSIDIEVSAVFKLGEIQGYDLIYGFLSLNENSSKYYRDTIKNWYVTTNITYGINIKDHPSMWDHYIKTTIEEKDKSALLSLGLEAGHSSRFKIDSRFPKGSFDEFYHKWVINSLDKVIADEVFMYDNGTGVLGFITVKLDATLGTIGLIAVDANTRGQRIGAKLIAAVCAYCQDKGIDKVQVSTQIANVGANNFYKQQGFEPLSQTEIYHFWI